MLMFHVPWPLPDEFQLRPAPPVASLQSSSTRTPIIDPDYLDLLLQRCATLRKAKQLHSLILLSGHHRSPFLASRLVFRYSCLGLLPSAISVFLSAASPPSSLVRNSILRALLSHGQPAEAISIYRRSRSLGTIPDGFTFPLALRACASLAVPFLSATIHAHAVVMGFHFHLHVANELITMYGHLNRMDLARKVFDAMPIRSVVTWNVLVSGHSRNRECEDARELFDLMLSTGPKPNQVTWTSLCSAYAHCQRHSEVVDLFNAMRRSGCQSTGETVAVVLSACPYLIAAGIEKGKEIHGFAKRSGFEDFSFVRNSLLCMYGKLGNSSDAESLFSEAAVKDLVSWNALISSYATAGRCYEAFEAFLRLEEAGEPTPNVVSWSAVIGGFASCGVMEQSVDLFRLMQKAGVHSNAVTLATVLSACADLSAMNAGKEIHAYSTRSFINDNVLIENGLLNLYTKSGSLKYGTSVFERMKDKDLISWNSMINGYGIHGFCENALSTYKCMISCGVEPDGITFISILSACSHAGRVAEGRRMFDLMVGKHGISPGMEHYSCLVDLLGRAGLAREASELVEKMPMRPNASVWGALLNSCRIHGFTAMTKDTASRIFGAEGETPGNCMLISNIYAAIGRWEDSARVRVLTKEKGLKKNPGQSWIEVKKTVHVFSACCSFPLGTGGYGIMEGLNRHMEKENELESDLLVNMVDRGG